MIGIIGEIHQGKTDHGARIRTLVRFKSVSITAIKY
jgi:hypothetical protein